MTLRITLLICTIAAAMIGWGGQAGADPVLPVDGENVTHCLGVVKFAADTPDPDDPTACGENETYYDDCVPCEERIDKDGNLVSQSCPEKCKKGCACSPGTGRNDKGACVKPK
ncbi:trypsin inhibitor-like cysteine-rich domain-containing protein [Nocardia brasiliensis]